MTAKKKKKKAIDVGVQGYIETRIPVVVTHADKTGIKVNLDGQTYWWVNPDQFEFSPCL